MPELVRYPTKLEGLPAPRVMHGAALPGAAFQSEFFRTSPNMKFQEKNEAASVSKKCERRVRKISNFRDPW